MGGWTDGQAKTKKIMYFQNISKTMGYFFLVVSRPLRRVLQTFSDKNSKKIQFLFFSKNFEQFFFQRFCRNFEVYSRGDLVDFLGVCSSGFLERISILTVS